MLKLDKSKNLHILLHSLRQYLTRHALPPLAPALPDMHSSTSSYITLQNLFKAQHLADLTEFRSILAEVLGALGLPIEAVSEEEVESFVKGAGSVGILRGSPLIEGKGENGLLRNAVGKHIREKSCAELIIPAACYGPDADEYLKPLPLGCHLAILAAERFHSMHSRWPGVTHDVASDCAELEDNVRIDISEGVPKLAGELPVEVVQAIAEVLV